MIDITLFYVDKHKHYVQKILETKRVHMHYNRWKFYDIIF